MTFLLILVGWVFTLCLHEFAHAWAAWRGGDTTVKAKGYLTLNPLRFTHPLYSIVLPIVFLAIGGIALPGGAVYIERQRLRGPGWESAVALAGPLTNLACAVLCSVPFWFGVPTQRHETLWAALAFFVFIQAMAAVLNLLPIPPLDGYGALEPWLPWRTRAMLAPLKGYGVFVLFALLWFVDPVAVLFFRVVRLIAVDILQVPPWLIATGLDNFRILRL